MRQVEIRPEILRSTRRRTGLGFVETTPATPTWTPGLLRRRSPGEPEEESQAGRAVRHAAVLFESPAFNTFWLPGHRAPFAGELFADGPFGRRRFPVTVIESEPPPPSAWLSAYWRPRVSIEEQFLPSVRREFPAALYTALSAPPPDGEGNVEQYSNLAETFVQSEGYTAGSGILSVISTAGNFPPKPNFRVAISDPTSGQVRVLLEVIEIVSSTEWAVIAEGPDAAGFSGDRVTGVLTAGAMDAIRSNISRVGTFASLPASSLSRQGDRFNATDGYGFIFDQGAWVPYSRSALMRKPVETDYLSVNPGGSTLNDSGAGLVLRDAANETGIHMQVVAAPTAPYTLTAKASGIIQAITNKHPGFGVCFRESSTGGVETLQFANNSGSGLNFGSWIGVDYWSSPTSLASSPAAAIQFLTAGELWFQLTDAGGSGNRTFAISVDGVNWETILSEPRTTNINPDQIGFFVHTDGAAQIVSMTLESWSAG